MKEYLAEKFELSRGGGADNVRPMEGLRGFAVSLVFLVHYTGLIEPWVFNPSTLALAAAIHAIGSTGVDLFFVLSGYLIYGSLITRPQNFSKFMSRRIARIYPAFAVVFAVYLAMSFLFPAENKIPASLLEGSEYVVENFLLLPGIFPIIPMITVAWSLSYEMLYYLAIPLVIVILQLRRHSAATRVGLFSIAAVCIAIYCEAFGGPARLIMFISGVLLYETRASGKLVPRGDLVGFVALVCGLFVTLVPVYGSAGSAFKISVLFISFYFLCWACFQGPKTILPKAFSWTPLRWLGNMSYSYYLLHGLSLKGAFLALAIVLPKTTRYGDAIFWGLLPIMFAITLIPTAGLFLAIERPLSLAPSHSRDQLTPARVA